MPSVAAPTVVDHAGDSRVLDLLAAGTAPLTLQNVAAALRALWTMKQWLARVREARTAEQQRAAAAEGKRRKKQRPTSATALLRARLSSLGLRMLNIAGDGNCQFRSVSQQLFGTEAHHGLVRARAVAHIEQHSADFAAFCAGELSAYLKKMARDRTWGDELTLRAICESFGASVHVVSSSQENWHLQYEPAEQMGQKKIFLAYVSPVHYNAFEAAPAPAGAVEGAGSSSSSSSRSGGAAAAESARAGAKRGRDAEVEAAAPAAGGRRRSGRGK